MLFRPVCYTAPTAEPISLTEAKLHLRLAVDAVGAAAYTAEDSELTGRIAAVREAAETETWRKLVLQVWDLYLDEWPDEEIILPYPPLMSVEFVKYTDTAGVVTTLATTEYIVDRASEPGRIVLGYDKSWPDVELYPVNPIQIRFKCGYLVPFTATAATDVLAATNHPFTDGDKVRLSVSGGAPPTGLAVLTDFFVRDAVAGVSLKLAATSGGTAIDITGVGSGNMFLGELPFAINAGMKLILTDLQELRGNTVLERVGTPLLLPRAASHWLAMESVRRIV